MDKKIGMLTTEVNYVVGTYVEELHGLKTKKHFYRQ